MAQFIEIPITSADNLVLKADAIVTCLRTAATTTDIILEGGIGQTANLNMELTHAADTATASVAKAIMDGIILAKQNTRNPDVTLEITVPKAVSAVAIA